MVQYFLEVISFIIILFFHALQIDSCHIILTLRSSSRSPFDVGSWPASCCDEQRARTCSSPMTFPNMPIPCSNLPNTAYKADYH